MKNAKHRRPDNAAAHAQQVEADLEALVEVYKAAPPGSLERRAAARQVMVRRRALAELRRLPTDPVPLSADDAVLKEIAGA